MRQKQCIEINDLSNGQYTTSKKVRFKTSVLRTNLCDYSDAYIVLKGRVSVRGTNGANRIKKKQAFKNIIC